MCVSPSQCMLCFSSTATLYLCVQTSHCFPVMPSGQRHSPDRGSHWPPRHSHSDTHTHTHNIAFFIHLRNISIFFSVQLKTLVSHSCSRPVRSPRTPARTGGSSARSPPAGRRSGRSEGRTAAAALLRHRNRSGGSPNRHQSRRRRPGFHTHTHTYAGGGGEVS